MSQNLAALKERLGQLSDIGHAASLAHWDQQTMMPAGGSLARAESLATLARLGPRNVRRRRDGAPARGRRIRAERHGPATTMMRGSSG